MPLLLSSSSKRSGSNLRPTHRRISLCSSCFGSRQASRKSSYPEVPPTSSGGPERLPAMQRGVFDADLAHCAGQREGMGPAVTEVVLVEDEDRHIVGNAEIGKANVAGFEGLAIGPAVFVELGRTVDQTVNIELVEVAVGPAKSCLQDFVKLSEVEIEGQFERTRHLRLNADDMDVDADDGVIGVNHVPTLPRKPGGGYRRRQLRRILDQRCASGCTKPIALGVELEAGFATPQLHGRQDHRSMAAVDSAVPGLPRDGRLARSAVNLALLGFASPSREAASRPRRVTIHAARRWAREGRGGLLALQRASPGRYQEHPGTRTAGHRALRSLTRRSAAPASTHPAARGDGTARTHLSP